IGQPAPTAADFAARVCAKAFTAGGWRPRFFHLPRGRGDPWRCGRGRLLLDFPSQGELIEGCAAHRSVERKLFEAAGFFQPPIDDHDAVLTSRERAASVADRSVTPGRPISILTSDI